MSRGSEARRIARARDLTINVTTSKGKVVAEVQTPTADDHRHVLTEFGRLGWKTSVKNSGNTVRAEVTA